MFKDTGYNLMDSRKEDFLDVATMRKLYDFWEQGEAKDENGERLFEKVLKVSKEWATEDQMMYVVGATQGKLFEDVRKIVPDHFLLVPGVGAQGGSLEEVCQYGMNKSCGLLVNSSRGIIYADNSEDFALSAGKEARKIQLEMKALLEIYL